MINLPMHGRYTSFFGPRDGKLHDGVDIAAPAGTPIRAAWGGVVATAGWHDGWGWQVILNHGVLPDTGRQTLTRYAHMQARPHVTVGQRVEPNQVLGREGTTGSSTGPHLHFAMYYGTVANYSTARDPYPLLKVAPVVTYGIDVSRHQGDAINWAQVFAAGIQFATIKASEGTEAQTSLLTRDHFRRHMPVARAHIPLVGAYHVLRSADAARQVSWFLKQMDLAGDWRTMIHQLDYEKWDYDFPSYAHLKAFVQEHREQTDGHPLIIYCGKWIWDQVVGKPANAAADLRVAGLWDSQYVAGAAHYVTLAQAVPATFWGGYGGWAQATILQYTSTGRLWGIPGNVDCNMYRGSIDQLRALLLAREEDDMYPEIAKIPADSVDVTMLPAKIDIGVSGDVVGYDMRRTGQVHKVVTSPETGLAKLHEKVDKIAIGGIDVSELAGEVAPLVADLLRGLIPSVEQIAEAVAEEAHRRSEA